MSSWGTTVQVNGEPVRVDWLTPEDYAAMNKPEAAPKPIAGFTRADQVVVKPVEWLIENWVAVDSLAGMVGPTGSCKTFLALDWACSVATGTPWLGNAVRKGAVFILAGEGRNGLRKRIEGWSVHHGIPLDGVPLYLASNLPTLTDQINAAGVIAEINAIAEEIFFIAGDEPSLIVIDTVARSMAGSNENSSEDMGYLIEAMDWMRTRWGCAVLSVHHTGHDNTGRARGSSSYRAALDSEVVLKPQGEAVQVMPSKAKDWQAPKALLLKRHSVAITVPGTGDQTSTLVLVDSGPAPAQVDRHQIVRDLQAKGLGVRDIEKQTGIPKSTVSRLLKDDRPVWDRDFADDDH